MKLSRNKLFGVLAVLVGLTLQARVIYPLVDDVLSNIFSDNLDIAGVIKIVVHTLILVFWFILALFLANK